MLCGLARCPGAKSTCFSVIPVIPFSHVHAIFSRLQCNTADLPSGRWVPTLPSQYPEYQRKQHGLELQMTRVLFLVLEMMLTYTSFIVTWFPDHM